MIFPRPWLILTRSSKKPLISRSLITITALYSIQGDLAESVAEYSKAIDNNPNYAAAFNNRAVAYYQLKEYDRAWDDLHKAESLGYSVKCRIHHCA